MSEPSRIRGASRRAGRVWPVVALSGALYAVVLGSYAQRFDGHVSGFICLGDQFIPPERIPPGVVYLRNSAGYDGQFFYLAARDPFLRSDLHRYMDAPAYRYQRILYPWLAAGLAFGQTEHIPLALVVVNVLAVLMGTAFAGLLFRQAGMSPWYALFYSLLSGLLLATLRDLSAPTAMGFLMGAMYASRQGRPWACAALLAASILAREQAVLVLPVLFVDGFFVKRDRRAAFVPLLSLVPVAAWAACLFLTFGELPWAAGQDNLGRPFAAMIEYIRAVFSTDPRSRWEELYLVLFTAVTLLTVAYAVRLVARSPNEVSLALVGFSLMPFLMTRQVWVEPWSYGRVLVPSGVFLVLALARSRDRSFLVPLILHAALFGIVLLWLEVFG